MAMRRFRVAEESMLPTLSPGEEFVATDSRSPLVGDVVAFPHPNREDFWVVKRVGAIDPTEGIWVESDNKEAPVTDSRTLGHISPENLMPRVDRLDKTTFGEAIDLLAAADDALAVVVADHGDPPFWVRPPGFETLVLLILEQQVSLESGAAMYRRVEALLEEVTPESVLATGEDSLRQIGVTRQKAGYLLGLASRITKGELDLDDLGHDGPEEARSTLIGIKGIGPWTADAYLLSALRFPDMFPVGDRALQVGVREVLGLSADPSEDDLETLSEPWRPVRAAAVRLIWHAYLETRGRTEPF
jgi:DNA-3-methyladenine glycosylase II